LVDNIPFVFSQTVAKEKKPMTKWGRQLEALHLDVSWALCLLPFADFDL
jgi:hypothetical protein